MGDVMEKMCAEERAKERAKVLAKERKSIFETAKNMLKKGCITIEQAIESFKGLNAAQIRALRAMA